MTVFANYSFIFHLILLKFYRHVQNNLAQKLKFSKTGFGVPNVLKKFSVKMSFLQISHSFFIRSCSNLIGMCRMTLPKNVNFQKRDLGSKIFFKNYFSVKMTVIANYIFHLILLKFYRHVQNNLAQKHKFSKTGFGVQKFSKKFIFCKNYCFL